MPRAPRKRQKKHSPLTGDPPIEEFTEAWLETLARPGIAKDIKALADQEGISVDVLMCETISDGYHKRRKPLPPKLREYITKHPDMPEAKRRQLLTRDLN